MAKQLRKLLHGPSRVPLAFAEDILAKGFGYQNYYDLGQTAKTSPPAEPTATQSAARLAIFSGIKAALLLGEVTANEQELKHLIGSFALVSLVAFKCSRDLPLPGAAEPTKEDVQALERVIKASGSLRDQALFACMRAGVRPKEYLSAIYINQLGACLLGKTIRNADHGFEYSPMPQSCQGAVTKYAKAKKHSGGDLLFPSPKDPKLPMTAPELAKLLFTWAREANIEAGKLTANGIRKTTDVYQQHWMRRLGYQMGHRSPNSTLAYVAELPTSIG